MGSRTSHVLPTYTDVPGSYAAIKNRIPEPPHRQRKRRISNLSDGTEMVSAASISGNGKTDLMELLLLHKAVYVSLTALVQLSSPRTGKEDSACSLEIFCLIPSAQGHKSQLCRLLSHTEYANQSNNNEFDINVTQCCSHTSIEYRRSSHGFLEVLYVYGTR